MHAGRVQLYQLGPSGNCYRVRLLLTQLGVPFDTHEIPAIGRWMERVRAQPRHVNM